MLNYVLRNLAARRSGVRRTTLRVLPQRGGGPYKRCMTAPLPDAAPTNWVDRHAPPALRPWLKLGRFDRPAGIWLLMLPGWQGIALAGAMQRRLARPAADLACSRSARR